MIWAQIQFISFFLIFSTFPCGGIARPCMPPTKVAVAQIAADLASGARAVRHSDPSPLTMASTGVLPFDPASTEVYVLPPFSKVTPIIAGASPSHPRAQASASHTRVIIAPHAPALASSHHSRP